MRFIAMVMTAAAVLLLASTTPAQAAPYSGVTPAVTAVAVAPAVLTASGAQDPVIKVEIDTDDSSGRWYVQPVWLAVGGLALLVIIILVVMAARGGRSNTTVVK